MTVELISASPPNALLKIGDGFKATRWAKKYFAQGLVNPRSATASFYMYYIAYLLLSGRQFTFTDSESFWNIISYDNW